MANWKIGLYCVAFSFSASLVLANPIYVAVDGDNRNAGTLERPLASLEAAREMARARGAGAVVYLRGGRYFRRSTLELGKADSGFVCKAFQGEKVIIDGGISVDDSAFAPVKDKKILDRLRPEARGRVVAADLGWLGLEESELGQVGPRGWGRGGLAAPAEIFVNGKTMQLARWPNEGEIPLGKVHDSGSLFREDPKGKRPGVFEYDTPRARGWTQAKDLCIEGMFYASWANDIIPVAKIDTTAGTITTTEPHHYGFKQPGFLKIETYWHALNLLEEIDLPGEYFIDRDKGVLYLYPEHGLKGSRIQMSLSDKPFVKIKGAAKIRFEGIIFENNRANGFEIRDCSNCVIAGCTFRNMGNWAVSIYGGSQCGVQSCDIYNMGAGGASLNGGNRRLLEPSGHFMCNCEVHGVNRWDNSYKTPVFLTGVGQIVKNNHFYDARGQALVFLGNDHVIEYNEMHHVLKDMSDQGPIYAGRNPTYCGNRIRYNFIHHIKNYHKGGAGVQGIFFDDAMLFPGVVFGNVFYKAGTTGVVKYNVGGGGTLANNITVDCPKLLEGGHLEHVKRAIGRMHGEQDIHDFVSKLKQVDISSDPYRKQYPYLYNAFKGIDEARATPVWNNYEVTGDYSQFVDAGNMNFSLIKNSEVLKMRTSGVTDPVFGAKNQDMNFKPIPFVQIGLKRDSYRKDILPSAFDLIQPKAGEKVKGAQIEFVWEPSHNADGYTLTISKDIAGKEIVRKIQSETHFATVNGLEKGRKFFWSVQARNTRSKSSRGVTTRKSQGHFTLL